MAALDAREKLILAASRALNAKAEDVELVTGGTVRNLAKVDRRMRPDYPISRLHGYTIDRRRLDDAHLTERGLVPFGRVDPDGSAG